MSGDSYEIDVHRERPVYVVVNSLRMKRDVKRTSFLLVEGSTDKTVFENFIDQENCEIFVVPSEKNARQNLIDIITILNETPQFGAVGIIDSDFSIISDNHVTIPNLLLTDGHDLETLIIMSPALDKILREYGQESKMENFVNKRNNITDELLNISSSLGYLRWINEKTLGLNLKFSDLKFSKFINRSEWSLNLDSMINAVINNTRNSRPNAVMLESEINMLKSEKYDLTHVCCGHDLVEVLSIGLLRVLGTYDNKELSSEQIDRSLRLAYDFRFFKMSTLYASIINWESSNIPYKVMLDDLINEESQPHEFSMSI